mmetsp:Transcript_24458/g.70482  ORF Transcript_24458/g.70482 Transcript_24458/m.70482 type:complete len:213 (+) Transcript_24458:567-1205(+)
MRGGRIGRWLLRWRARGSARWKRRRHVARTRCGHFAGHVARDGRGCIAGYVARNRRRASWGRSTRRNAAQLPTRAGRAGRIAPGGDLQIRIAAIIVIPKAGIGKVDWCSRVSLGGLLRPILARQTGPCGTDETTIVVLISIGTLQRCTGGRCRRRGGEAHRPLKLATVLAGMTSPIVSDTARKEGLRDSVPSGLRRRCGEEKEQGRGGCCDR